MLNLSVDSYGSMKGRERVTPTKSFQSCRWCSYNYDVTFSKKKLMKTPP